MSSYNYTSFYYRLSHALRIVSKSIIFLCKVAFLPRSRPIFPFVIHVIRCSVLHNILYLSVYRSYSKCYNVLYKLQCSVLHIVLYRHLGG